jgi:hypothetical protein
MREEVDEYDFVPMLRDIHLTNTVVPHDQLILLDSVLLIKWLIG